MTDEDEDEISPLAMSIMGSVAYGGPLPRTVSEHEVSQLSEYEALVIDRAIRKMGRTLTYCQNDREFTIEDGER